MAANGIPSALTTASNGRGQSATENEGTIEMTLSWIRTISKRISSTENYRKFSNIHWFLRANNGEKWNNFSSYLDVYLRHETDSESSFWYGEINVTFKLRSQQPDVGPFIRQHSTMINFYRKETRFPRFIEINHLFKRGSPYVKRNEAMLEAHIVVKKSIIAPNYSHCPLVDFTQPNGQNADGVLVVEGVRLYVSKSYLSIHSPVFAAMFHGEFRERQMEEVELKDVKREEFVELLRVIYPPQKPVNANNVEILLKLGDQFQMRHVINACETYLVNAKDINMFPKLALGDKYHLCALLRACLNSLETTGHVVSITSSLEYIDFSAPTKLALLDRVANVARQW